MKLIDRFLQMIRVAKVKPYVRPNIRVLDIGCADGLLHQRFPEIGYYIGVDPDASECRHQGNGTFICGSFPSTAVPSCERFDLVTALAVLEHIPHEQQADFARACADCLVSGGYLVVTVPSPSVDKILTVLKKLSLLDGMHEEQHYGFDPSTTPGLFESHGFSLTSHRRFEVGLNHLFVFRRT